MLAEECGAFLHALSGEAVKGLRLNRLKLKPGVIPGLPDDLTKVPWERDGRYYDASLPFGKHPYHEAGVYYIQEPSAMAPAVLLDVRPGERILDLCAAPGGKSTQIAGYLQGRGLLVCNEIHQGRAEILSQNIERMGIANAIVTNETPDRLAERFGGYFDKILVDAPCSGEGMFRKNTEAIREWSRENVILCAKRQDEILRAAVKMLKPGGRMVYSTCTFAPEEDEGTILRLLQREEDFEVLTVPAAYGMECGSFSYLAGEIESQSAVAAQELSDTQKATDAQELWDTQKATDAQELWDTQKATDAQKAAVGRTLRLFPHKIRGEGHFLAVLERKGTVLPSSGVSAGELASLRETEIEAFLQFQQRHLHTAFHQAQAAFLRFGDRLYLLPKDAPSLKGLRVLRPGLQLGSFRKNRFEPSHALALHLQSTDAVNIISFPSASPAINAYLNGQIYRPTVEVKEGECVHAEGVRILMRDLHAPWTLVLADEFPIGWSKFAGGVFKNHYPRGLRRNN